MAETTLRPGHELVHFHNIMTAGDDQTGSSTVAMAATGTVIMTNCGRQPVLFHFGQSVSRSMYDLGIFVITV